MKTTLLLLFLICSQHIFAQKKILIKELSESICRCVQNKKVKMNSEEYKLVFGECYSKYINRNRKRIVEEFSKKKKNTTFNEKLEEDLRVFDLVIQKIDRQLLKICKIKDEVVQILEF